MATLTFVYAESVAVVGPLATAREPHSWDLCERHAAGITVPRGWEMVRSESSFTRPIREDDDLTALAEAVREVGGAIVPRVPDAPRDHPRPAMPPPSVPAADTSRPRPGRRGHLRVLPDPLD